MSALRSVHRMKNIAKALSLTCSGEVALECADQQLFKADQLFLLALVTV